MDLGPLRERLLAECDLDIGFLRREKIEPVVAAHMAELGVGTVAELSSGIGQNAGLYMRLVEDLIAPPDRFFEDPELTSLLKDQIIPDLIAARRASGQIRVWVANCRQGHIAYDVAMLLLDALGPDADELTVRVFATDPDPAMVAAARSQSYPSDRVAELGARGTALKDRARGGDLLGSARSVIVFGAHDTVHQAPYSRQDLILCRGYLPVLPTEARQRVAGKLVQGLAMGGVLVGGRGESVGLGSEPPSPARPFSVLVRRIPHAADLKADFDAEAVTHRQTEEFAAHLRMPAFVVDAAGSIVASNEAALDILGGEGLAGRSLRGARAGGLLADVRKAVKAVTGSGVPRAARCKGGWAAGVASILRDPLDPPFAAVVLLGCEVGDVLPGERAYRDAVLEDAVLQVAEVIARKWEQDRELERLTRQSATMTQSLYLQTVALSSASERLERTNIELRIANRRLEDALAEREKAQQQLQTAYDREHHIADTLQRSLLPTSAERYDGYSVATRYRAAFEEAEVGGDFFHIGRSPKGRLILALGDVAGKGLEAAVFAYMVKNMLLGFSSEDPAPSSVLARLNEAVGHYAEAGQFVTLVYLLLDLQTGRIEMGNAGHEPVACCSGSSGIVDYVFPTGRALGIMPHGSYGQAELNLEPGDVLLVYTDGLSEAGDRANPFGHEGVGNLLRAEASRSPDGILERLYETAVGLSRGRLVDDAAAICLKRES